MKKGSKLTKEERVRRRMKIRITKGLKNEITYIGSKSHKKQLRTNKIKRMKLDMRDKIDDLIILCNTELMNSKLMLRIAYLERVFKTERALRDRRLKIKLINNKKAIVYRGSMKAPFAWFTEKRVVFFNSVLKKTLKNDSEFKKLFL